VVTAAIAVKNPPTRIICALERREELLMIEKYGKSQCEERRTEQEEKIGKKVWNTDCNTFLNYTTKYVNVTANSSEEFERNLDFTKMRAT
jgi:hypothetical protein